MSKHIWKPTTNTLAVWKCSKCLAIGFSPHPLPETGCQQQATSDTSKEQ